MKYLVILYCIFSLSSSYAQDAKELYEEGLKLAQNNKPEEAIKLFDRSIALKGDEYVTWFNRGVAKTMLNLNEDAFKDFEQTIKLKPDYAKAYLNRGTARKRLTDYEGAMLDYNFALTLDSNFNDAYYFRGVLYNLLGKRIEACLDFERALKLNSVKAQPKMKSCKDKPIADTSWHAILRLTQTADSSSYGFTEKNPLKVGSGPDGGPGNQRNYFDLLRDARGKPIKYQRTGGCCPYKSAHGMMAGMAMLDTYEIVYLDAGGVEKTATIYTTFYDYEEPKILFGFKTVSPPK